MYCKQIPVNNLNINRKHYDALLTTRNGPNIVVWHLSKSGQKYGRGRICHKRPDVGPAGAGAEIRYIPRNGTLKETIYCTRPINRPAERSLLALRTGCSGNTGLQASLGGMVITQSQRDSASGLLCTPAISNSNHLTEDDTTHN